MREAVLRFAAIAGMGWLVATGASAAEADQAACEAPGSSLIEWFLNHQEEIASLMQPEDEAPYQAQLAAGRCSEAIDLIVSRFRAVFPEMECFFDPTEPLRQATLVGAYVSTIPKFLGIRLCVAEESLAQGLVAFADAGVMPPLAQDHRDIDQAAREFGDLMRLAYSIDWAVDLLKESCESDRCQPACVAYARLANDGVVVKHPDAVIYFLLVRARLAGFDSPERARLETEVGARLSETARAEQETKAQAELAEWSWSSPGLMDTIRL